MNWLSPFLFVGAITSVVYAQEMITTAADPILATSDPLLSMIAGGGITLPSAIIISAFMLSKWRPTIRLELKPVKIISIDRPIDE